MTAVTTTTKSSEEQPVEEPTTPETEAETEAPEDEALAEVWGAVDEGFDDEDAPTREEPESESGTEPETAAEEEAEPAQEAEEAAPAGEEVETETPAKAETETETETPRQEQETKEEPEPEPVDVDALWAQREQSLVDEHRIDDDTAELILTDPKEHLPKLLAKAQARAERMIWENVNQAMPEAIQRVLSEQQTETEQKDAFYEAWPQLQSYVQKNPDAEKTIQRMRDMFLQQPDANKMTSEEIIQHVGAAASVALGVPLQGQSSGNGQQQQQQQPAKQKETPRSSPAARTASSGQGKKLGAFEALDASFDDGGEDTSVERGAALF